MWLEIHVNRGPNYLFGTCYVPPGEDSHFDLIENSISLASKANRFWILTGDFNARSFAIGDDRENSTMANALMYCLDSCDGVINNTFGEKTRVHPQNQEQDSILDLTISSPDLAGLISRWKCDTENFHSDHGAITFDISCRPLIQNNLRLREVWNLQNGDWQKFQSTLKSRLGLPHGVVNLQTAVT